MTQSPSASDWAGGRGEKWRTELGSMEAMLAPVNAPLIRAMRLDAPCRVADIGCGGGGSTFEILRQAPAGSVVHGFDVSPTLVEAARELIPDGNRNVAFHLADVGTAPPPARSYDRLVSRFGVMFFDDPSAAFVNLARWLAPDGRFAFAVWGQPAENAWLMTVREVVAQFVEIPRADPEAPGLFRYADAGKLATLLESAGFGEISIEKWRGLLPIGGKRTAAEAAEFALSSFSSFGELLASAGQEAFDAARRRLTEHLSREERDGAVMLEASIHLVTGEGPE